MKIITKKVEINNTCGWERELILNRRRASRLFVLKYLMYIGRTQVDMAGIGGVFTEPEFRNKGLARKLIKDTVNFMKEKKFDVSLLFGIKDFYTKFGYATVLCEDCKVEILTRQAEHVKIKNKYKISHFIKRDISDIIRIYNSNYFGKTAAVVRKKKLWKGFCRGSNWGVKVKCIIIRDKKNKISGYIVIDDSTEEINVCEIGYITKDIFSIIIRYLADLAIKLRLEKINFLLPLSHPIIEYCSKFDCKVKFSCIRNGGPMMRIISIKQLFKKLEEEFNVRYKGFINKEQLYGNYRITTDIGDIYFKVNKDGVFISEFLEKIDGSLKILQDKLSQLLMGYRSIDDIILNNECEVSSKMIPLIRVLFPRSLNYFLITDKF